MSKDARFTAGAPAVDEKSSTRDLLARAQGGDEGAREHLVEQNLRLVAAIARRFQPVPVEYDDFFQVGCIGLLKAIDRFDLKFDVQFSTYAVPVILGEMRQYARSRHPLGVGRTLRDTARRALQAGEDLTQRLGREPSVTEIAEHLSMEAEEVAMALDGMRPVASLEQPAFPGEDGDSLLGDMLPDSTGQGGRIDVDNLVLKEALRRLTPWERRLVALRFFADQPQTEVARRLGVSQAHVSRTERRILRSFREFVESS